MEDALKRVRAGGEIVVRATRTGSGIVVRNGQEKDDEKDWIVTADQNPQKARLLMSLVLLKTSDTKTLQAIMYRS